MGCTLNKVLDKLGTVHADYIRLVGTVLLLQDVRFLRVYNLQTKSANKPSTSCVRTACPKLSTRLEQTVNNLFNNLVDIIRFVARLSQQVRYSHDITILLQPCVVKLVTFLLYHDCIRLVRTCNLVTSLIMPSSLLQVVNSLFQTC
jgi:hypothetical protein